MTFKTFLLALLVFLVAPTVLAIDTPTTQTPADNYIVWGNTIDLDCSGSSGNVTYEWDGGLLMNASFYPTHNTSQTTCSYTPHASCGGTGGNKLQLSVNHVNGYGGTTQAVAYINSTTHEWEVGDIIEFHATFSGNGPYGDEIFYQNMYVAGQQIPIQGQDTQKRCGGTSTCAGDPHINNLGAYVVYIVNSSAMKIYKGSFAGTLTYNNTITGINLGSTDILKNRLHQDTSQYSGGGISLYLEYFRIYKGGQLPQTTSLANGSSLNWRCRACNATNTTQCSNYTGYNTAYTMSFYNCTPGSAEEALNYSLKDEQNESFVNGDLTVNLDFGTYNFLDTQTGVITSLIV